MCYVRSKINFVNFESLQTVLGTKPKCNKILSLDN